MTVINSNQGSVKASEVATDTIQPGLSTARLEDLNTVVNQLRKLAAAALRKSTMFFRSTGEVRWDFNSGNPSATQFQLLTTSNIEVGFLTTESAASTVDLKVLTMNSGGSNTNTTFNSIPLLDGQCLVIELSQTASESDNVVGNAASASATTLPRLVIYPDSALPSLMVAQTDTAFSGAISIPLCIRKDTRLIWLINGDSWPSNFQSSIGFWNSSGNVTTQTVTTTTTLTNDNKLIFLDGSSGSYLVTLPTAVGNTGKEFTFVRTDTTTNTVSLDPFSVELINTLDLWQLQGFNRALTIVSDGSNWKVISDYAEYDAVRVLTSSASLTLNNDLVLLSSASNMTITLPNPIGAAGKKIRFKKINPTTTSIMTILPFSGETIDGAAQYRIAVPFHMVELTSSGTAWLVTGQEVPSPRYESTPGTFTIPFSTQGNISNVITWTSTGRPYRVMVEYPNVGTYMQATGGGGQATVSWVIDGSALAGTLFQDFTYYAPAMTARLPALSPGTHTAVLQGSMQLNSGTNQTVGIRIVLEEIY